MKAVCQGSTKEGKIFMICNVNLLISSCSDFKKSYQRQQLNEDITSNILKLVASLEKVLSEFVMETVGQSLRYVFYCFLPEVCNKTNKKLTAFWELHTSYVASYSNQQLRAFE